MDSASGRGITAHVVEEISAYLDGALSATEQERVRLHLDSCAACRTEYVEMSATRQALRSIPVVVPPRAFTLTEAMVGQPAPRRAGLWQSLLARRNAPRLALGSALAFVLLVLVIAGNLVSTREAATFTAANSSLSKQSPVSAGAPPPTVAAAAGAGTQDNQSSVAQETATPGQVLAAPAPPSGGAAGLPQATPEVTPAQGTITESAPTSAAASSAAGESASPTPARLAQRVAVPSPTGETAEVSGVAPATAQPSAPGNTNWGVLAVEGLLGLLAVAFAAGALLARRSS